jgi:hypothetical protein
MLYLAVTSLLVFFLMRPRLWVGFGEHFSLQESHSDPAASAAYQDANGGHPSSQGTNNYPNSQNFGEEKALEGRQAPYTNQAHPPLKR